MKLIVRGCVLVACLLLLWNCRQEPIQNVTDNPIPRELHNLTLDAIEAQIIAGGSNPWQFQRVNPGLLAGNLNWGGHIVKVDVIVTQKAYSIRHVSTVRMNEKDGEIHYKYNRWINMLQRKIDTFLAQYAATLPR